MAGPLTQDMTDRLTGRRKRKRPLVMVGVALLLFSVAAIGRCVAMDRCEERGGTWDNTAQSCAESAAGASEAPESAE